MYEKCKSWDHTFAVGDRVFDLLSQQLVTILKIELVTDDGRGGYEEERQSVKPSDDGNFGEDTFFVVTVNVESEMKVAAARSRSFVCPKKLSGIAVSTACHQQNMRLRSKRRW